MYETNYHRASSIDDAVAQFAKGTDSRFLSGGQTLLPVMKQRLAAPSDVIDVAKIKDMIGIDVSGDTVTIRPRPRITTSRKATPCRRRSRRSPIWRR